jgi:hypothetical protein
MTRTSKSKRIAVGLSLAATFAAGYWLNRARAAGIPATAPLTYSGTLTAGDGMALTGQRTIQVALHTQASGGSAACSSAAATVTLAAGTFQVSLGDACTAIVHANRDLWIDVLVDGTSLGRAKLGAVPYAVEADIATTAAAASGGLATTIQTLMTDVQNLTARIAALGCPTGYYQAGPNLCVESATDLHAGTDMYTASSVCRGLGAHVCTRNEMLQACAARGTNGIPADFNPYSGALGGWYSDHGAIDNDFIAWSIGSCFDDNDSAARTFSSVLPFRCCK